MEPGYYWAKDADPDQRASAWNIVRVIEPYPFSNPNHIVLVIGTEMVYDLTDFIFGPRILPPTNPNPTKKA